MMAASRRPSDMKPARVGRLARLPVFLALDGKRALVAGGSAPAAWKAELLAAAGAHVEVFSPRISDELVHLLADSPRKKIVWHRRDWRSDDLAGAAIAVGAFDDERSAAAFAGAARIHGVPVNVMVAPIVPGLTDHEVPKILEAAADAGATSAGFVLLRLPHAVKPIFLDWAERNYPDRRAKIEGLIRETRDGKLYQTEWGTRQRGTGPYAEQIQQTFALFVRKFKLDRRLPEHDHSLFRPPQQTSGQMSLF